VLRQPRSEPVIPTEATRLFLRTVFCAPGRVAEDPGNINKLNIAIRGDRPRAENPFARFFVVDSVSSIYYTTRHAISRLLLLVSILGST
jgi:hypothetical protein